MPATTTATPPIRSTTPGCDGLARREHDAEPEPQQRRRRDGSDDDVHVAEGGVGEHGARFTIVSSRHTQTTVTWTVTMPSTTMTTSGIAGRDDIRVVQVDGQQGHHHELDEQRAGEHHREHDAQGEQGQISHRTSFNRVSIIIYR